MIELQSKERKMFLMISPNLMEWLITYKPLSQQSKAKLIDTFTIALEMEKFKLLKPGMLLSMLLEEMPLVTILGIYTEEI